FYGSIGAIIGSGSKAFFIPIETTIQEDRLDKCEIPEILQIPLIPLALVAHPVVVAAARYPRRFAHPGDVDEIVALFYY
ncbi:MAG: hypothetical protein JEY71_12230, partial [Sphaerochaeta sp.]|nr:hypothetical protein [Sphaerochaeta sp.]